MRLREVARGRRRDRLPRGRPPRRSTPPGTRASEVVGLTSGASVPDELLDPIIEDLKARGVTKIEPVVLTEEDVEFRLPDELEA